MEGWLKLHRELLDKPIWTLSTPEQKTILITLLLMANHDQNKWEFKGQQYICRPGQFITSLESITEKAGKGVSIRNTRTALKRFEKMEFLTNESTKQNRLITICNWPIYQAKKDDTDKQYDNQVTNDRQTGDKQVTTNKNNKNDLKNNKIIYFQNPDLNDLFFSFLDNRKKLKKPATEKAIQLLVKKLNSFPDDQCRIRSIEKSIMSGYSDVFEQKGPTTNEKQPQFSESGVQLQPLYR
jgi:hypothetical protein